MAADVAAWCFMSNFAISLEDDAFVWATAEVEIADHEMASDCVVQFASILFARMQMKLQTGAIAASALRPGTATRSW